MSVFVLSGDLAHVLVILSIFMNESCRCLVCQDRSWRLHLKPPQGPMGVIRALWTSTSGKAARVEPIRLKSRSSPEITLCWIPRSIWPSWAPWKCHLHSTPRWCHLHSRPRPWGGCFLLWGRSPPERTCWWPSGAISGSESFTPLQTGSRSLYC